MNADKNGGKGSLKVRFQENGQKKEFKSLSNSKTSTIKEGKGASPLKSSPP